MSPEVDVRFPVSGTQSRPAGIPLFVLARNNLNPRVEATDEALVVKVVRTNRLPWSTLRNVHRSSGLLTTCLCVTSGGWEYILHFRDMEALAALERTIAERSP